MEDRQSIEELLKFMKALSDANRLKILGLLAKENLSVEQLAEILDLRPSTVSHHLSRLAEVGLVSARAESYYNIYQMEPKALEQVAQRLLSQELLPSAIADVDLDAYDRKMVANYSKPDGRLKDLPAQRKKLDAVLRHIVRAFEPGLRYSEKEVNELLARFHDDTATLRRELIGARLLARSSSGGEYWRVTE
ncbi:MAG TPA: metalloregulator ArsR/SmtB family transcription factor [Anaerolineales bacterium]